MSTTPEGRVKNEVKRQLKRLGVYQFWPVQTGMGAKTVDCLACLRGCFVAIETKAPGKKPTPLQWTTLTNIARAGGITLVIDSVDMAKLLPEVLDAAYRAFTAQQGNCSGPTDMAGVNPGHVV
jgi:hypothetical protein